MLRRTEVVSAACAGVAHPPSTKPDYVQVGMTALARWEQDLRPAHGVPAAVGRTAAGARRE